MEIKTQFSMERAKNDVQFFYRWLGYTWGTHIGEWMDMYSDRKGAQVHRVCLIAPRGHSKSTTLRVLFYIFPNLRKQGHGFKEA